MFPPSAPDRRQRGTSAVRESGHAKSVLIAPPVLLLWVKGGIDLAFSEKTAFGSQSCLCAYGIARNQGQPLSTLLRRMPSSATNAHAETI